jgi:1,4-dihydroxy-2-naphthoate octaprenyltransferase
MATSTQWREGARLRTLPAAVAPVLVGSGAAAQLDGFEVVKAVLALLVALLLQIGVNFANDYSDGIRGTDTDRVGPLRLVGSGAATPAAVKRAAFACFGGAAVAGLALAASSSWWLIVLGAAAIAAAWGYTGGASPYGYRGLGEVSVFCFFGLAAVLGTTYTQAGRLNRGAVIGAVGIGLLACALLMVNNVRDIAGDDLAGKRTVAVRLGDRGSRRVYAILVVVPFLLLAGAGTPWAALALIGVPLAGWAVRVTARGAAGPALIAVLRATGQTELLYAIGLGIGLALAS